MARRSASIEARHCVRGGRTVTPDPLSAEPSNRGSAPRWLDAESLYQEFPDGLASVPAGRPLLAINMVATVDGKAVVGGRAAGIGSRFDRTVMDRIRAGFDMVLVGAQTLRSEAVNTAVRPEVAAKREERGLTPQPIAAVVTGSGDLPSTSGFFTRAGLTRVVFTTERAIVEHQLEFEALARRARIVVLGENQVDLVAMARFVRKEMGVQRLLCEGGPSLNHQLLKLDLVDELFLTLAPRVVGGRATTIVDADLPPALDFRRLELLSAAARDSELFLRYRVSRT